MTFKKELKQFNIDIDDIETTFDFYKNISKAIEEMQIKENKNNLEVILNDNLLKIKDKRSGLITIFGLKVSLQKLEESISFIVRETIPEEKIDYKQEYLKLKEKLAMILGDNGTL